MFQPIMVYSDFLIKENIFTQGQFLSQYNKKIHLEKSNFSYHFQIELSVYHNCTKCKKHQIMIFHNKDAKRGHFHCFLYMWARSSGMVNVGGCQFIKKKTAAEKS